MGHGRELFLFLHPLKNLPTGGDSTSAREWGDFTTFQVFDCPLHFVFSVSENERGSKLCSLIICYASHVDLMFFKRTDKNG